MPSLDLELTAERTAQQGGREPHSGADTPGRRLLLISCHFPPVGGAGVQRPVKFVKYLHRLGWEVSVLTVANPSVPAFDESLCRDIPAEVHIERAPTWEPGYQLKKNVSANTEQQQFGWLSRLKRWPRQVARRAVLTMLQPDPQVLWVPPAFRAAKQFWKQHPHDAILVTAPPYSSYFIGAWLKQRTGALLILDFRDEWDLSSAYLENAQRDWFSRTLQQRMQRKLLRAADAVIATTPASADRLRERCRQFGSKAEAVSIYNGFDPEDFPQLTTRSIPSSDRKRFRIVYTGTLWNLTTVEPLARAVQMLAERDPATLAKLEFLFVGRQTSGQQQFLQQIQQAGCAVEVLGYCPHTAALQHMQSADALCLLLSDVPGADRVVPAKLFEYLAMQREILGILPSGEAATILREFTPENHILPGNVEQLANWLTERTRRDNSRAPNPCYMGDQLKPFTRPAQAGELSALLERVIARAGVSATLANSQEVERW